MSFRGRIRESDVFGFFPSLETQPVTPNSAADPAIADADLRNFLLVEFAILCRSFMISGLTDRITTTSLKLLNVSTLPCKLRLPA